jgi:hypothetical protein
MLGWLYLLQNLLVCLMVFNTTFNNISAISWRQFYWWRKPKYPGKTTDLSQVSGVKHHQTNKQIFFSGVQETYDF